MPPEMALPRSIARFNSRATNRFTRLFAGRLPGFGIVSHVGRRSGRTYRTPVNVFRDGERYVIALTYGAESEWVKNAMAAGGCALRTRGRTVQLTDPRIVTDSGTSLMPAAIRPILSLIRVTEFMVMKPRPRQAAPGT
jgi:deazaflavin-dependent oxidoreductase (nitroreductase family)